MNTRIPYAVQAWLTMITLKVAGRLHPVTEPADPEAEDHDRGDVPGWVMITVMTAIVVIALLAVFRDQVVTAVQNAFESVSGAG
jgi:hypothetical protein